MDASNGKQERSASSSYWRANLRILAVLLSVWFLSGCLLSIVFVEPLNKIKVGGFPLGFWFAQQGTIYVFIVLVFVYAALMERLDQKHGVSGDQ
ncbi:MAG: hypothetical protein M2R45_00313 [Verrucomicrobia subdivision 3 bacterium]|nr:hypothetical protein [Limisphaerales bacterium]MCS1412928.1 hypothetical protein [Limisphaerales bacterium]